MDELTLFAALRPDDRPTDADLHALRAELFPELLPSTPQPTEIDSDDAVVMPLTRTPEPDGAVRQRSIRVAVAAAAVVAVGLGGRWAVTDGHDGQAPLDPATQPAQEASPASPPATTSVYDLPLIGFTETGWTVVGAFDDTTRPPRAVVWLSEAGFDGPWVEIKVTGSGAETMTTVPSGGGTVNVAGHSADVTEIDDGVILRWTDGTGTQIEAFGWDADLDQTVAVAAPAVVTATGIAIDALPPGASLADPAAVEALGRHASYRFAHTDGRQVEVTFQPGGARGLYQRQGPTGDFPLEDRTPISIGGEPATIVNWNDGEYRVDVQRGFWTWEFNTAGFTSQQQVIDLVTGSTIVDVDTWTTSLSDSVIAPDQRTAMIDDLLVGVPLPPGFDAAPLAAVATEDRYQLIAEVSGAVTCGWFDEWLAAGATGDPVRREEAAAALASAHDWAMLDEIADRGGWTQAVLRLVDAVNGIGTDVEAASENIGLGLGCDGFD